MAAAVKLRTDYSVVDLLRLTAGSRHANQSRRLLSLAAVMDGMDREQAARIGGMDRQTLRDWVHRFNEGGPDGLKDIRSKGHPPRLSTDQLVALATIVETGPDRAVDGVVRWRRIDLQKVMRDQGDARLPSRARSALTALVFQIEALSHEIEAFECDIVQDVRGDEEMRRLTAIPGIGPITAAALKALVPDIAGFKSARHFAAWLGLTPRPHSSGGK